ncbi:MAG TPA: DUF4126 domain-containing protein, partial [Vicinamibacteria bacterium]|nr:DUF4126 domain-containing protein [Vicinamibacteria bacterium]
AAKAGLRAASTVTTAGLANPLLSVTEDLSTVVLFVIALVAPIIVALLVLFALLLILKGAGRRRPEAAELG